MASKVQGTFGTLVFMAAMGAGMYLGSSAVAQNAAPPAATTTEVPPPGSPAAMTPGQAPPPSTTMPAPDTLPAFGAGAYRAADQIINDSNSNVGRATNAPKPAPSNAPSEVETFIPTPVKTSDPRAILHTSYGDITIRLYQSQAPRTVKNFIDLARGDREFADAQTSKRSRRPFYTNMIFHRVVPGYLIQTGCPFGTGRGSPGYSINDEVTPNVRFYKPYMVAMAPQRDNGKNVKDSNGSQFFISMQPMPDWDDKFTIFGEVERGKAIVDKIAKAKVGPTDRPIRRVFLFSVDIVDETTANAIMAAEQTGKQPVGAPAAEKAPASVGQ